MSSTGHTVLDEREFNRANGVYYTPPPIAAEVTRWAVTSSDDFVLDPSHGGGVFIAAALRRLSHLGSSSPGRQVFGIDSDARAVARTRALTGNGVPRRHLVNADFFSVSPDDFTRRFDAIIGNPPYVKHHNIDPLLLRAAQEQIAEQGLSLSGRSSYWAYFVVNALPFISTGGKLALILPGAFFHADYAASVREAVLANFERVTVLAIDEKVFSDAQEESLILLAEGRGRACSEVRVGRTSESTLRLDAATLHRCTRSIDGTQRDRPWIRGILSEATVGVYEELVSRFAKLGDVGTVRIGTVTGGNSFFTLRPSELESAGIPRAYAQPIITRATQTRASVLTKADIRTLLRQDEKALLFRPPNVETLHPQAAKYIEYGASLGLRNRYKCSKREPWYMVPVSRPPDAFLLYMSNTAPRLILNSARAHCTNAIHAVTWRDTSPITPINAALASLTTLAHLGAELEGRSYGDGVLKIEPSAGNRLPLPAGASGRFSRELRQANRLLRSGRPDEATQLADRMLLPQVVSDSELDLLREAVFELRSRRLRRGLSRPKTA